MKNLDLGTMFQSLFSAVGKFRLTIFIVVVVGGLALAVITLDGILQNPSSDGSVKSQVDTTTFDQVTIDRLKQLHTSTDGSGAYVVPSGRINPFSE